MDAVIVVAGILGYPYFLGHSTVWPMISISGGLGLVASVGGWVVACWYKASLKEPLSIVPCLCAGCLCTLVVVLSSYRYSVPSWQTQAGVGERASG